jgi:PAS domain S-box-containing protein
MEAILATTTERGYEALGQQTDALQIIFESLPWGVIVADDEGRFLFCNPAAEKILRVGIVEVVSESRTSIDGWYLSDQITLIPPERLPLVRAIRGEKVSDELVFVRNSQEPDGIWIRVNAWPLRTPTGETSGGVVMFHDFTQGREAMQTILLLSQVVEQTADSVVVTDRHGIIQYVNPAFESTSGYGREEVLGKTPRILKSDLHDAEFYRQMWAQLNKGLAFNGMLINRKKTGELFWAQQTITPMRDESDHLTHFVSVSQDITELRKKQEQEFQLQLARDVQQRFYPASPAIPGFDIGAYAHPADETGGDYFDFISMQDGSLLIAVGDVKGHGFSSALVMALTRAYIRCFAAMQLELDDILHRTNQMLLNDLEFGHFVTLSLTRLHPFHRTLTHASAGHVPGFVFLDSGELKGALDSSGPPLGLFPNSTFSLHPPIQLASGEVAILLTDGVTESPTPDGDQFGVQRVLDYMQTHLQDSASQIAHGIYDATRTFVKDDPQDDDITSVIIKVDTSE